MGCGFPNCRFQPKANGYCGKHQDYATEPLPVKKYVIPKVSAKRQGQLNVYHHETKADHLRKFPFCQICQQVMDYKEAGGEAGWWPKCGKIAVETHHVDGRENERLNESPLLSSCDSKQFPRNGHAWIKEHPQQAELLQLVISKNKVRK